MAGSRHQTTNLRREQIDDILSLYADGRLKLREIAARYGIHPDAFSKLAGRCLVPLRQPRVTKDQRRQLLAAVGAGRRARHVGPEVGISPAYAVYLARKAAEAGDAR